MSDIECPSEAPGTCTRGSHFPAWCDCAVIELVQRAHDEATKAERERCVNAVRSMRGGHAPTTDRAIRRIRGQEPEERNDAMQTIAVACVPREPRGGHDT